MSLLYGLTMIAALSTLASAGPAAAGRPKALVYRGSAGCEGCSESLAQLLKDSASHFEVDYVGPEEKFDISEKALEGVDLYAFPGGPGT